MIEFSVAGPFKVPLTRAATGAVDLDLKKCIAQLPAEHDGFQERGCYVFSLSVPYGYRPAYVGKTVNATIIKEAFNPSNQLKITRHLNDIRRVDGLYISIVFKSSSGWARNAEEIGQLEEWLIANAASKNPDLLNRRSLPRQNWRVRGVENSGVGRPDSMAVDFKLMMGLGQLPKKPTPGSTTATEFAQAPVFVDQPEVGSEPSEPQADSAAPPATNAPDMTS
jgi:hypothetical protein